MNCKRPSHSNCSSFFNSSKSPTSKRSCPIRKAVSQHSLRLMTRTSFLVNHHHTDDGQWNIFYKCTVELTPIHRDTIQLELQFLLLVLQRQPFGLLVTIRDHCRLLCVCVHVPFCWGPEKKEKRVTSKPRRGIEVKVVSENNAICAQ